jgi:hypothetical protein
LIWIATFASAAFMLADLWLAAQTRLIALTAATDPTIAGMAVIGAVLVSLRPRNPVGWILCGISFVGSFGQFAWSYGYYAVAVAPPDKPLGAQLLWVGTWIWLVGVGVGLPVLTARLPDGHAGRRTRVVDWLAIAGSAALVGASALMPGPLDFRTTVQNPFGIAGAGPWFIALRWAGYLAVGAAELVAVGALVGRLRGSRGDEREQLKWIASSGAVMTAALIYGFARQVVGDQDLYGALVPFLIATVTLPLSIGVAVLKYRLYQIDLIINRTLVYGSLTAGLAGLYALSLALAQMLVGVAAQRSDTAILLTAFVGTTAFTPAKGWLQKVVDTRFAVRDPAANVDSLRAQVEVVAQVLDAQRIARRLVEDLAVDYGARFVSLSLKSGGKPVTFHSIGDASGMAAVAIVMHNRGEEVGVLSLGERHGGLSYTSRDHHALQLCADAVAEVIGLSNRAPAPVA